MLVYSNNVLKIGWGGGEKNPKSVKLVTNSLAQDKLLSLWMKMMLWISTCNLTRLFYKEFDISPVLLLIKAGLTLFLWKRRKWVFLLLIVCLVKSVQEWHIIGHVEVAQYCDSSGEEQQSPPSQRGSLEDQRSFSDVTILLINTENNG